MPEVGIVMTLRDRISATMKTIKNFLSMNNNKTMEAKDNAFKGYYAGPYDTINANTE